LLGEPLPWEEKHLKFWRRESYRWNDFEEAHGLGEALEIL